MAEGRSGDTVVTVSGVSQAVGLEGLLGMRFRSSAKEGSAMRLNLILGIAAGRSEAVWASQITVRACSRPQSQPGS